jgi:hypothetical protein
LRLGRDAQIGAAVVEKVSVPVVDLRFVLLDDHEMVHIEVSMAQRGGRVSEMLRPIDVPAEQREKREVLFITEGVWAAVDGDGADGGGNRSGGGSLLRIRWVAVRRNGRRGCRRRRGDGFRVTFLGPFPLLKIKKAQRA